LILAGILILIVEFLFSLVFMQAVATYAEGADVQDPILSDMQTQFGSIPKAMTALFNSVNGGDPEAVNRILEKVGDPWTSVFSFYMFFMCFGLMNILIGVFSSRALRVSNLDRDILVKQTQDEQEELAIVIKELFEEIGPDSDGEITWAQFSQSLKSAQTSAYFSYRGLNVLDAPEMFRWMDEFDGSPSETMKFDEFLIGMMRLTGAPKNSDLMVLLQESRSQRDMLQWLITEVWKQRELLEQREQSELLEQRERNELLEL
jgi:hypothetical protein